VPKGAESIVRLRGEPHIIIIFWDIVYVVRNYKRAKSNIIFNKERKLLLVTT